MKKVVVMVLLIACLCGCGITNETGVSQEKYDALLADYNALQADYELLAETVAGVMGNIDLEKEVEQEAATSVPAGRFDSDTVMSQLEVTEYSYSGMFSEYAFLAVKNNSEYNLDVSVAIKFYNAAGELVGAENSSENAFEKGTEILFYFMPDEEFEKMEYEFSVSEEEWYECVVSDLTYETVSAKDKEIVSVTNNGDEVAEFVEGSALFFLGDKLVDFDQTYFTDDNSEIKPGKTITKEMDCYEEYDSVKLFFTGRR